MKALNIFSNLSPDNGSGMHRLWTDNGPMKSRKLFAVLFCLLFVGVGQMWGADPTVTFDYTSSSQWTTWGISAPSSGKGVDLTPANNYAVGVVTMNVTHGTSTNTRVWNKSGTLELRFYSGSTITFSISSGYAIKSIQFNSTSSFTIGDPTGGSMPSNTWTPKSGTSPTSVRLDASGSATLRNVVVTYASTAACSADPTVGAASLNGSF